MTASLQPAMGWSEFECFTPALDTDTQNVSGSKRTAYLLRETMRAVTQRERLRKCGHCRFAPYVYLVRGPGQPATWYSGLVLCGSSWCCPVCSSKIAARRADELTQGLTNWLASGGKVLFLTLTMPHDYGDKLRTSVQTVRGAFRRILQGRAFKTAKATWGIAGSVAALEVTHGRHGWHPHLHILWFLERALTDEEIEALRRWFFERWAAGVRKMKFRAPNPRNCPLERVAGPAIGSYVSKFGAAVEMARWDRKTGRYGNRTPFQILSAIRQSNDPVDIQCWLEYEEAMYRVQQLTWSKGLRRQLGVGSDVNDAELAADDGEGQTLAIIRPELWDELRDRLSLRVGLLDAIEAGGFAGALAFLHQHLAYSAEWIQVRFIDPASIPVSIREDSPYWEVAP